MVQFYVLEAIKISPLCPKAVLSCIQGYLYFNIFVLPNLFDQFTLVSTRLLAGVLPLLDHHRWLGLQLLRLERTVSLRLLGAGPGVGTGQEAGEDARARAAPDVADISDWGHSTLQEGGVVI